MTKAELQSTYAKAWYVANKELCVSRAKAWKAANPEKAKASARAKQARIRATQPGLVNAATAKRKAHIKQATPPWANEFFIAEAYDLAAKREQVCGGKWHVDHVIPLRGKLVSGLHVETNLQVIRAGVNQRKHATFNI